MKEFIIVYIYHIYIIQPVENVALVAQRYYYKQQQLIKKSKNDDSPSP